MNAAVNAPTSPTAPTLITPPQPSRVDSPAFSLLLVSAGVELLSELELPLLLFEDEFPPVDELLPLEELLFEELSLGISGSTVLLLPVESLSTGG